MQAFMREKTSVRALRRCIGPPQRRFPEVVELIRQPFLGGSHCDTVCVPTSAVSTATTRSIGAVVTKQIYLAKNVAAARGGFGGFGSLALAVSRNGPAIGTGPPELLHF